MDCREEQIWNKLSPPRMRGNRQNFMVFRDSCGKVLVKWG